MAKKKEYNPETYEIGGMVRTYRLEANLTQRQLGERIGKSGNDISRYEKNDCEMGVSVLIKIADALGIHPVLLLPERTRADVTGRRLSPKEETLLDNFSKLNSKNQDLLIEMAGMILKHQKSEPMLFESICGT